MAVSDWTFELSLAQSVLARYSRLLHAAAGDGHHVVSPLGAWMVVASDAWGDPAGQAAARVRASAAQRFADEADEFAGRVPVILDQIRIEAEAERARKEGEGPVPLAQ